MGGGMFRHRLKCSLKLVGTIMIAFTPLIIMTVVAITLIRYFIRRDIAVFSLFYSVDKLLYLLIGVLGQAVILSIIVALTKWEVPDTNMAGYRQFLRDNLRN
jgi:hypothetical protein